MARVKNSNDIYLTFDDGPDPTSTPLILNLLENYNVRASFFVVGSKVELYPELVEKIKNSGHAIGEHGYNHIHPWKTGPIRSLKDVLNSIKVFNSTLFPNGLSIYRPPYGKYNIISLLYYLVKNKKPVFWNIDARDYDAHASEQVARNIIERMKPGSVILLHDSRQNKQLGPVNVTIEALEQILKASSSMGLRFRSIEGLFHD